MNIERGLICITFVGESNSIVTTGTSVRYSVSSNCKLLMIFIKLLHYKGDSQSPFDLIYQNYTDLYTILDSV